MKDPKISKNPRSSRNPNNTEGKRIFTFEDLAAYVVKKEVLKFEEEIRVNQAQISFFTTCFEDKAETNKNGRTPRKTITVWFEIKTTYPPFWDLQPVVIVYKGHQLFLSDIRERAQEFFLLSLQRLKKRYFALMID